MSTSALGTTELSYYDEKDMNESFLSKNPTRYTVHTGILINTTF